ncbi:peptidyl-prolyl cis-trans isomerase, EpsD family [Rugamonas sp. FT82W]|uniref:peptidylprolyl isomerase n=1 Tax=Duganella vulcania TaxID=2692166 RepID=A0A845G194_9BURK|nr:peptidyl-prolyl cis-trans isomerase, EpsD family [Duganella vulcania]
MNAITGLVAGKGVPLNKRALCAAVVLIAAAGLSACGGSKDKKPGQSLVSVNGEEITITQLNEELQRANVQPAQQEAAKKQLLDSLVDRQLLLNEASKEKLDRDPRVVQAVERAKALVIAQAYMQKRVGAIAKPTKEEITAYFNEHPEFFSQRKQIDMKELVIATNAMTPALKAAMDGAKSLEEVAAWLDANKVGYSRAQIARTTADLPPELGSKLLSLPKGQLFIIKENERSLLIQISEIKDAPQTLAASENQIAQFLYNKKTKAAADAELARLRAAAKIEYLDKAAAPASASASASAAAPAASASSEADANARGVAGLK